MAGRRTIHLIRHFLTAYPIRTAAMVALLILAGLAEGIGVATLLPVLEVATGSASAETTSIGRLARSTLRSLGLEPTLGSLLALVVAAVAAKGAFRWLAMREVGHAVARVAADLRLRLFRAVLAARWSHFTTQPTGHFAAAASAEALHASYAYRRACAALAVGIQIVVYCGVAFLVSWALAAAALVGGAAITILLGGFVRVSRRSGRDHTVAVRALIARTTEIVQGVKAIKAMGRERPFLGHLEAETGRLEHAERRLVLAHEAIQSFHEPALAAAVAVGLYSAATWGDQLLSALLLMVFLFHRVVGRFHLLQTEYQGMVAAESAFWALDAQIRAAEGEREPTAGVLAPPPIESGISFEDVSFSHGRRQVLRAISLTIPAGAFVAVAGRSGAGKTTLVDLILGLYLPNAGVVRVDGIPLQRLDLNAWRRTIGYVPQETTLLYDTIARNIALGVQGAGREEVERALRDAEALDFVAKLPDGVDTVVGERGLNLSGGERQRLGIARALVGRPRLLILDEATAGLDAETEAAICATLRRLRGGITIVAVSHHRAVADASDRVYDVDAGALAERIPSLAGP